MYVVIYFIFWLILLGYIYMLTSPSLSGSRSVFFSRRYHLTIIFYSYLSFNMWFQSALAPLLLSLPLRSTAGPVSPLHRQQRQQPQNSLTEVMLSCIAPSSNTCAGATFPQECATASQALPYILDSFQTYKITSWGEQAAIVSLMAFESADFKYNKNHFPAPGRPGQGSM